MTKCKGCGITLQTENEKKLGYIEEESQLICQRCFKLSNYGEYSKVSLKNKDYEQILTTIDQNALIVYTSDFLSLNLNNLKKFNKILLVITKRDIMPKSIKDQKIINYIKAKHSNILDIVIISSKKNYNIDFLYNKILNLSNNKEVYLVGNTNTGKSTLLNKLIQNYSNTKLENSITVSMFPSTTLDKVIVNLNDLTIIDTPGLIEEGNITNYLSKKELKKISITKEIKPKTCQIKGSGSILIDNFARIDYQTKESNSIVIYASNNLKIRFNSLKKDTLKNLSMKNYHLDKKQDIVIPGLCFIKCIKPIKIKLYLQKEIIPYIRDNLI